MRNSIFQALMNRQMNPLDLLARQGINIPKESQGSSKDMVQYLIDNGTMDKNACDQVMSQLQRMGFKF